MANENFDAPVQSFCEGINGDFEYINTITSLPMVLSGSLLLFRGRHNSTMMRFLGAAFAINGLGSAIFHATLIAGFGYFDTNPLLTWLYFLSFLILDCAAFKHFHHDKKKPKIYRKVSGSLMICFAFFWNSALVVHVFLDDYFALLVVFPVGFMITGFILCRYHTHKQYFKEYKGDEGIKQAAKSLWVGVSLTLTASLLWFSTEPFCAQLVDGHGAGLKWLRWVPAHGFFHLFMSIGLYHLVTFLIFSDLVNKEFQLPSFVKGSSRMGRYFYHIFPVIKGEPPAYFGVIRNEFNRPSPSCPNLASISGVTVQRYNSSSLQKVNAKSMSSLQRHKSDARMHGFDLDSSLSQTLTLESSSTFSQARINPKLQSIPSSVSVDKLNDVSNSVSTRGSKLHRHVSMPRQSTLSRFSNTGGFHMANNMSPISRHRTASSSTSLARTNSTQLADSQSRLTSASMSNVGSSASNSMYMLPSSSSQNRLASMLPSVRRRSSGGPIVPAMVSISRSSSVSRPSTATTPPTPSSRNSVSVGYQSIADGPSISATSNPAKMIFMKGHKVMPPMSDGRFITHSGNNLSRKSSKKQAVAVGALRLDKAVSNDTTTMGTTAHSSAITSGEEGSDSYPSVTSSGYTKSSDESNASRMDL